MSHEVLLLSNLLEQPEIFEFVRTARKRSPGVSFLVCGDLLNVFPEPGEDLDKSIFHEIHGGDLLSTEMAALVSTRFRTAAQCPLVPALRDMFSPTGARFDLARQIAQRRYRAFFDRMRPALGDSQLYFIPGNMDYPDLALVGASADARTRMVDQVTFRIGSYTFGALGGIPNTSHPFRGVTEISPYEMCEREYERRLWALRGVDALVTHQSPKEYPPLAEFIARTDLRLLVCRAPFDFSGSDGFRGKSRAYTLESARVIEVRPFDVPVNSALVLRLDGTSSTADDIRVERIRCGRSRTRAAYVTQRACSGRTD